MPQRVLTNTAPTRRRRPRWAAWLTAGGFGGEPLVWFRRPAPGEGLAGEPSQIYWRPWLTAGGYGGDTLPWFRRPPRFDDPPPPVPVKFWGAWLTAGGFGGEPLPWFKRPAPADGLAGEPSRGPPWSPGLAAALQPAQVDPLPYFRRLVWADDPPADPRRAPGWRPLLTAGGYGGDFLPWKLALVAPPEPPPAEPPALPRPPRPWLSAAGYGGDFVPWLRRLIPAAEAPPAEWFAAPARAWLGAAELLPWRRPPAAAAAPFAEEFYPARPAWRYSPQPAYAEALVWRPRRRGPEEVEREGSARRAWFAGLAAAAAASGAFRDTFTDANGTSLPAHAPDTPVGSNRWANTNGTWDTQGNKAHCATDSGSGQNVTLYDVGTGELDPFTLDYAKGSSSDDGMVFRAQDNSNYWLVRFDGPGNTAVLYQRVAGTFNMVGSPVSFTWGAVNTMKVVARGASVQVYGDATLLFSVTDGYLQTATKIGLRCHVAATQGSWDNVNVSSAGETLVWFRRPPVALVEWPDLRRLANPAGALVFPPKGPPGPADPSRRVSPAPKALASSPAPKALRGDPPVKALTVSPAPRALSCSPAPKALSVTPAPGGVMATTLIEVDPSDVVPLTMNFGRDPLLATGNCTVTVCSAAAAALAGSTGTYSVGAVSLSGGAQNPLCTVTGSGGSDSMDYGVRYTATLSDGTHTYTRVLGLVVQVRKEAENE